MRQTTKLRWRRGCSAALLAVAVVLLMGASDEDARFSNLGHKLMCVCGCNQVLLECNHVGCNYSERMRGELSASMERGDSDGLVLQSFIQRYGPTVLIAPTTTGFNRIAWVMPYLVLVLGLTTVVFIVRAWNHGHEPGSGGGIGGGAGSPGSGPELDRFRQQARRETEI